MIASEIPVDQMANEALRAELQQLRDLFTWVPPEVTRHLTSIGKLARIHTRGKDAYLGVVQGLSVEVTHMEVAVQEVINDFIHNKEFHESKLIIFPVSSLSFYEVIEEREEREKEKIRSSTDRLLDDVGFGD